METLGRRERRERREREEKRGREEQGDDKTRQANEREDKIQLETYNEQKLPTKMVPKLRHTGSSDSHIQSLRMAKLHNFMCKCTSDSQTRVRTQLHRVNNLWEREISVS